MEPGYLGKGAWGRRQVLQPVDGAGPEELDQHRRGIGSLSRSRDGGRRDPEIVQHRVCSVQTRAVRM